MTRGEFTEKVAWRAGATADEADRLLEAIMEELGAALAAGEEVDLGALGTFRGTLGGLRYVPGTAVEAAARHAAG